MKLISPADIERRYRRIEERFAAAFSETPAALNPWLSAAAFVLVFAALALTFHDFLRSTPAFYGREFYRVYEVGILSALTLQILSLIILLLGAKRNALILLSAILTSELVAGFFLYSGEGANGIVVLILAPVFSLGSYLYLRLPHNKRNRLLPIFALIFFLAWLTSLMWIYQTSSLDLFRFFWLLKIPFVGLTAIVLSKLSFEGEVNPLIALNPAHGVRSALWPTDTRPITTGTADLWKSWWRGQPNLIVGGTLFTVALAMFRIQPPVPHVSLLYFQALLADVAMFNIICGVSRSWGFQSRDATSFVFLSRSPADFWRRGSVYNYIFVLHHLFFPLLKVLRVRFLAAFGAFSFFFLTHWGGFWIVWYFSSSSNPEFQSRIAFAYCLDFLLSFLAIWASQRRWIFQSESTDESPLKQWLSVISTHAIFVAIGFFVYVKLFKLAQF